MILTRDSELVIGLVAPVGANLTVVTTILEDRFRHFGYTSQVIRLSSLIREIDGLETELKEEPYIDYLRSYQTAGNEARRNANRGDFLALSAIYQVAQRRDPISTPLKREAHILHSLKHPDEVATLRQTYGSGFFLLGVHAPFQTRLEFLTRDKNIPEEEAVAILERDEDESDDPFGQHTRDTFELCDAFIALHRTDFKEEIWRILDLLFGHPYITPTRDEYAMFLAYAASLRSADLSRQVGAVIMSEAGEIISTGANDVPKYGGGLYWSDDGENDQRDYRRGYDSNAQRRNGMVRDVVRKLDPEGTSEDDDHLLSRGKDLLKDTGLLDITEFGRAVHAEMEAILSCTRAGASPRHGTLFCTTFPCHNCAKHIVAAGIKRVVYVEPYPKSQAKRLHDDTIEIAAPANSNGTKVAFEPFVGVGPRRFMDLFSLRLSSGQRVVRNKGGVVINWDRATAQLRVPMEPTSYLERETLLINELHELLEDENADSEETQ
jgi:deoxycytidylate deaminase